MIPYNKYYIKEADDLSERLYWKIIHILISYFIDFKKPSIKWLVDVPLSYNH